MHRLALLGLVVVAMTWRGDYGVDTKHANEKLDVAKVQAIHEYAIASGFFGWKDRRARQLEALRRGRQGALIIPASVATRAGR